MITLCMGSAFIYQNTLTHNFRLRRPHRLICKSITKTTPGDASVDLRRRSGNYLTSHWDHRYLLSSENAYVKEKEVISRDLLKQKVKKLLYDETKSHLEQLEFIDNLEKLGVSYHFEQEIYNILTDFHHKNEWKCDKEEDLYATALEFRLLRQYGFDISEDIFDMIVDKIKINKFKIGDIESIISLYEASYLSTKADTNLQRVIRPFTIQQLRKFVDNNDTYNINIREKAIHILQMPYHWRMRRLETKWYIDAYKKKHDMNLVLIQFAIIDFNTVQTAHQEELKHVSRWWKETCLSEQLPFVRDRIVENYFWTVGLMYEPKFGNIRRIMTILITFVTIIDDIYDTYGNVEELELFTDMVEKWDINRLDVLPEYMRLCFFVLFNEVNRIGCEILKYNKIDVIPFLKNSWAELCKAYLIEAKWSKRGYKPSVKEYMENAWISSGTPLCLFYFYCVFYNQISVQMLESLSKHGQDIVRCVATVLRLTNDLGTSSEELARGDVLKSVQCYMRETGASEEMARAHLQQMISDTWDEMNYEAKTTRSFQCFVDTAMNTARMAHCIYQYDDGHGSPYNAKTVDRLKSLFVDPIPFD